MLKLDEDIQKRRFHRFNLLYGEETFLSHAYRKGLKNLLATPGDDMNTLVLEGDEISFDEIADFGMLSPFMSERRLLIIMDSGFFSKADNLKSFDPGSDRLIELMGNLPETTYILFEEKNVNPKNGRLHFFEGKEGLRSIPPKPRRSDILVTRFDKKTGKELGEWISGYAAHNGKEISRRAAYMLMERMGNDMYILSMELDKLIGYVGSKKMITEPDIEVITGGVVQTRIYEMVDAVAEGDGTKALSLYRNLVYNKEDTSEIMAGLRRQFDTLYRIKTYEGSGLKNSDIAKKARIPDRISWKINSFMNTAKKFSHDRLRFLVEYSLELDEQVKTMGMNRQVATELFLIQALTKE
ncbi:MAG: DNA polymerase III subunit delta [Eubacterium sp.]|nr:DNA polymerase III subunit delta [Eubacterium sp.]